MSIFADDFRDLMTQQVSVRTFTGRTDEGVPVYSATNTYLCRVNLQMKNIIGKDGQMVTARGTAWLDTASPISTNDEVTLPDGSIAVLLLVNQESDENGPAYTGLIFQ